MRHITRNLRAISPVLAVLMMIAVAIAGSLVTYAWVMGYIGFTTEKSGQAIMIQSIAYDDDTDELFVYVQNVGEGVVELDPDGCLYVNGELMTGVGGGGTVEEKETATLTADYPDLAGKVTVKVTSMLGTFSEMSTYPAEGSGGGGPGPGNDPPTAAFTFSPTDPDAGDTVTFTDGSSDSDGTVVAWLWDFDDGSPTSALQNPTHVFASGGTYSVELTVWDDDGATDDFTDDVTVTATPIILTLRPNGSGSTTELSNSDSGWPNWLENWECVYESTSDESGTYVYGYDDDNRETDTYNVPDQSLSGIITNVRIYIRALESEDRPGDTYAWTAIRIGSGSIQYGIRLDLSTSWTDYYSDYALKTGNLGSGDWTWADINNLQIGVGLESHQSISAWRYARCTQVWVEVTYTP